MQWAREYLGNQFRRRRIRYATLTFGLMAINVTLWWRVAAGGLPGDVMLSLTLIVSIASVFAVALLWKSPVDRSPLSGPARNTVAAHEAGHAVAAYLVAPPMLGGITLELGIAGHRTFPRLSGWRTGSSMRSELQVLVAGMAAEELFAGETGPHCAPDLAAATGLAVEMIGLHGLGGSLVSFAPAGGSRSSLVERVLEDPRARKDIETLLRETKREITRGLLENRHIVIAIRDALLRSGSLSAQQVRSVIQQAEARQMADDHVLVDLRVGEQKPVIGLVSDG